MATTEAEADPPIALAITFLSLMDTGTDPAATDRAFRDWVYSLCNERVPAEELKFIGVGANATHTRYPKWIRTGTHMPRYTMESWYDTALMETMTQQEAGISGVSGWYCGSLAEALGRAQYFASAKPWVQTDAPLSLTIILDQLRALQRRHHHQESTSTATVRQACGRVTKAVAAADDDNDDDEDEIADEIFGPACMTVDDSIEPGLMRLLSYTPTDMRTQLALQWAVLLGLRYDWPRSQRWVLHWVLHALLPGFIHPYLVELWPSVVRVWLQGFASWTVPEPDPSMVAYTGDRHVCWRFRDKAIELAPHVDWLRSWLAQQLSALTLSQDWTLTPSFVPPLYAQVLRALGLYKPGAQHGTEMVPVFTDVTDAVRYCLRVLCITTMLTRMALQPVPRGARLDQYFINDVARHALYTKFEPRLRLVWHSLFFEQALLQHLQLPSASDVHIHVLSLWH